MTMPRTGSEQAGTSPAAVVEWLRAGNERFVAGRPTDRDHLAQAAATSSDQFPLAAVLGCIDSRVPVEAVLDVAIGDVFVARSAGNVVDDDVLGGLEFATAVAGAKVVVVLGHAACGAVKGACDGAELGHLTQLLAKITPAVETASGGDPTPGSDDPELVARAVAANVANSIAAIRSSEVLSGLEQSDDLLVIGAVYDLATGRIEWDPPS